MIPSAPAAAAASARGATLFGRPAADGSTTIGRWVRSFRSGTAAKSSVSSYRRSNVRMPCSQRMTFGLPSTSTYSAAETSSSTVFAVPRRRITGRLS